MRPLVIVPTYNERENLAPLLTEITSALAGRSYEVIIVDDGSTDGTLEALKAMRAQFPQLRILALERNAGQTAAFAAGFRAARAPVVITLDADMQNDPADIPRLAPAGIIASMQPTHQTSDRLMAEKRLGPDRLKGAYAWQSVIKSGARIAFGSDYPVESPNPFPGIAAAVSRQDMNGEPQGGWIPEERVSFEQALSGFTRDAAYAGFAEQKFGALEPGKWADFIIVDMVAEAASGKSSPKEAAERAQKRAERYYKV